MKLKSLYIVVLLLSVSIGQPSSLMGEDSASIDARSNPTQRVQLMRGNSASEEVEELIEVHVQANVPQQVQLMVPRVEAGPLFIGKMKEKRRELAKKKYWRLLSIKNLRSEERAVIYEALGLIHADSGEIRKEIRAYKESLACPNLSKNHLDRLVQRQREACEYFVDHYACTDSERKLAYMELARVYWYQEQLPACAWVSVHLRTQFGVPGPVIFSIQADTRAWERDTIVEENYGRNPTLVERLQLKGLLCRFQEDRQVIEDIEFF